ncbi:uncharacterized protein DS421_16g542830 [Arachis hypogaea]|nr:uncharacterized protein DS421_16g542830 [Arachis hypogaea]
MDETCAAVLLAAVAIAVRGCAPPFVTARSPSKLSTATLLLVPFVIGYASVLACGV